MRKSKFGAMAPAEVRGLKELEDESARLKKWVADLSLDRQILQDVLKQSPSAAGKRWLVTEAVSTFDGSERRACGALCVARSSQRYERRRPDCAA